MSGSERMKPYGLFAVSKRIETCFIANMVMNLSSSLETIRETRTSHLI